LRLPDSEVLVPIYSPIAVQGLGAGAITSSVQIMLSDLVTLRERGTFSGLMVMCVSSLCLSALCFWKPADNLVALGHSVVVLVLS